MVRFRHVCRDAPREVCGPAGRLHRAHAAAVGRHRGTRRRLRRHRGRGPRDGSRVDHVIDVLSTYVGHASVSDTYWYVTAIPELLALAAQRFAHSAERGDV